MAKKARRLCRLRIGISMECGRVRGHRGKCLVSPRARPKLSAAGTVILTKTAALGAERMADQVDKALVDNLVFPEGEAVVDLGSLCEDMGVKVPPNETPIQASIGDVAVAVTVGVAEALKKREAAFEVKAEELRQREDAILRATRAFEEDRRRFDQAEAARRKRRKTLHPEERFRRALAKLLGKHMRKDGTRAPDLVVDHVVRSLESFVQVAEWLGDEGPPALGSAFPSPRELWRQVFPYDQWSAKRAAGKED